MPYSVERLASDVWPMASPDGVHWERARPMTGPLLWRLKDAWGVLTGKYDAVYFGRPHA